MQGLHVHVGSQIAYCYTMSNTNNGSCRMPVLFAREGQARLVVRRDTWADLLMRDVD